MKRRRQTRDQKLASGGRFALDGIGGYWVLVPLDGGWTAAQRLARVDGALLVTELRVYPSEVGPLVDGVRERYYRMPAGQWDPSSTPIPAGGISSRLVRRVPVGASLAACVLDDWLDAILGERPDRHGVALKSPEDQKATAREIARALLGGGEPAVQGPAMAETPSPRKGGRKPLPIAFLEKIASEYNEGGRYPAQEIAERRGVPRPTATGWILKARRAGLITKTTQGRASRSANRPDWIKRARAHGLLNGDSQNTTTKGKGK